jgi:uncharacterized protein
MDYNGARRYITSRMRTALSADLYYHGLHHALDVLRMAVELCRSEGVVGARAALVRTAALYHDAGFLTGGHSGHELQGCLLAEQTLPSFGYTDSDVRAVVGMIMSTKIPQSPTNILEAILCDADLDYLGRADYPEIAKSLYDELGAYQLLHDGHDWKAIQLSFLRQHRYHTATNLARREPGKQLRIRYLEGL